MIITTIKQSENQELRLIKKMTITLISLGLFFILFTFSKTALNFFKARLAKASSRTLTSKIDFNNGSFVNTESDSKDGQVQLSSANSFGPRVYRSPNLPLNDQAGIVSDDQYIYVIANGDNHFARYIISENRWQTLALSPHYAFPGTDLLIQGNYIYAIFGGYQKEFSRYSILDNTWEELPQLLDFVYSGASLATDGTEIYALRGNGQVTLWKFTLGEDPVTTGEWTAVRDAPATIGAGAGIVYHNGFLYTPRGGSTSYNQFYRYNISANSWTAMAVVPSGSTFQINHNVDIDSENGVIYMTRSGYSGVLKYTIDSNTANPGVWAVVSGTNPQTASGVGLVHITDGTTANGSLFVFRGGGTYDFWKYDLNTNQYAGAPDLPVGATYGSDMLSFNLSGTNYLYYVAGAGGTNFRRYNLQTLVWETSATSPAIGQSSRDVKGVVSGTAMYFFLGNSNVYQQYIPITNTWKAMGTTPANVNDGAGLVSTGNGFVYATQGGGNRNFYKWQIGDPGTWSVVGTIPDDGETNVGSRLATDGTDIYYFGGAGLNRLFKYTLSGTVWSVYDNLPFSPYWGTDVTYYNNKFYFISGYLRTDLWEYTVATKVWRRLQNVPGITTGNGINLGPYYGASIESDNNGTLYINYGQTLTYLQTLTISANNYANTGSWTSDILNFDYVSAWNNLEIEKTEAGDSSLTIQTRSSNDRITWNDGGGWIDTTGNVINSTTAPYLQVRVNFNAATGQSSTPILKKLVINYTGDSVAPSNPSTFVGKSQSAGGVTLVSGTGNTYAYPQPYFTWSNATDNQSIIGGYFVYFGTNPEADPEILGNYQINASYTVTQPLQNKVYYLITKTKDLAGNKSSGTTGFIYKYKGPSYETLTVTTQDEFNQGTLNNLAINSGALRLSGTEGLWLEKRIGLLPGAVSYGAALAMVEGNGTDSLKRLYTFQGNNQRNLYSYILSGTTWVTTGTIPPGSPALNVYNGGYLVEGPDKTLYAIKGQNNPTFWKFDIVANAWTEIVNDETPSFDYGATLVYDGTHYIYALKGNSSYVFKRYDPINNIWADLANTDFGAPTEHPADTVQNGGDLAINQSNGKIYAIQGQNYSGFSVYDIALDTWTRLTNVPALPNAGANIEYDPSTSAVYYFPGNTKPFFYKYDIQSATWSQLTNVPFTLTAGTAVKIVDGIIYVVRGGTQNVYQYNIAKSSWQFPVTDFWGNRFRGVEFNAFYYGANIVKGDGENYYLTRGYYDSSFVRYNPTTGETARLSDVPAGMYTGGELVYDSQHQRIYAMAQNMLMAFFEYDIATDTWREVTEAKPPYDTGDGAALVYDGTQYIYWTRNSNSFYKYDTISSGTWISSGTTMAAFGAGADLAVRNNYIYAVRGANTNNFYKYGPLNGTPSWVSVGTTPATITSDGFLVNGPTDAVLNKNYLYACRGVNTNVCWRYTIEDNNWSQIDPPLNIYTGGAGESDGNSRMLVIGAYNTTNTYNNGVYSYVFPNTNTTSFVESGSYLSMVYDLTSVYRFASLEIKYGTAPNNSLTVYTKSSSDNITWSDWAIATETKTIGTAISYKVNSTANRYFQLKLVMNSSDGIYSGVIDEFKLNYYQDTALPTNPADIGLSALSALGSGTNITSGTWYNYQTPYFDWPNAETDNGATDGENGSGVLGYYIYFGTNPVGDPTSITEGTFVTSSNYTGANLISGKTYYLRVQTKDNAANLAGTVWEAFTYKYDNLPPLAISSSYITVSPDSYSAVKDGYDFSWDTTTDDGSGVSGYCYKTSQSGFSEACIAGTSINNLSAYQTGNNTFYLRIKDYANNYTSYSDITYKYSGSAISAPENLIVSSTMSTTYTDFEFGWDLPLAGSYSVPTSNIQFFYSMNEKPTNSTIENLEIPLTYNERSIKYINNAEMYKNLLSGTNVFYVVAWDGTYTENENKTKETRNINWDNYASVNFTYDSNAPNPAEDLDIADISIKADEKWKIAVTWSQPTIVSSTVLSYKVYRTTSDTTECGLDSQEVGYITGTSFADDVSALGQQTYYYCVKTCEETRSNCSTATETISLYPDGKWTAAPILIASPSASVKTKSATITWSTNRASNTFVKYSKSADNLKQESGSSTQVLAHTLDLTGLDPGTTYYYKAIWTDEDGNKGESGIVTFITNPAPFVSNVKVTDISLYTATVSFTVKNANKATVQFGKTLSYGGTSSISTSKSEATYSIALNGLSDGSIYNLRIMAEDEEANTYSSDNYSFSTLAVPKITNLKIQQVVGMPTATLRLVWNSNTNISTLVTYYPTNNPELTRDYLNLTPLKTHEAILKDLKDETEYTFLITGKDSAGNQAKTDPKKIKTAADFRPPEILNFNVETTIVGIGEEARAKLLITWDTDEASSTQIEYGQGTTGSFSNTTQEDKTLVENHAVTITSLMPSAIYHLRVLSKDKAGNMARSDDNVVITPKSTRGAMELVIDNLSKTFGFLKDINK